MELGEFAPGTLVVCLVVRQRTERSTRMVLDSSTSSTSDRDKARFRRTDTKKETCHRKGQETDAKEARLVQSEGSDG